MTALSVNPPFPTFTDIDGDPLEAGYVYIGAAGLNPQTNPINVYWDAAQTIPAPQPIRTVGGFPSYNGSPGRLYVNSDYSITVRNRNGSLVYSALSATDRFSDVVVRTRFTYIDNYAALRSYDGQADGVYVYGYSAISDGGQGVFTYDASDILSSDNDGTIIVDVSGRRWKRQYSGPINVLWFGADQSGVSTSSSKIQTALNLDDIYIPAGTYLLTTRIEWPSNRVIYGDGYNSVLQAGADGLLGMLWSGDSSNKSNVVIRDIRINGGGQTSDIYTGFKRAIGIYVTRTTNLTIEDVYIEKCGVVKSALDPKDDNNYGGYGILIENRNGLVENVRINRVTAVNIAGGGGFRGDGIAVQGFNALGGIDEIDVVISNCWVSTVGRHCYTVAGETPESIPAGVKIINCYGEKSALDGVDLEEGYDVKISGCTFKSCGNDQTYYNPVTEYGATYRLLAGVAVGNSSTDCVVENCNFDGCYYGVTFGAGSGLLVQGNLFENSTTADLLQRLAQGGAAMRIIGNRLMTAGKDTLLFYRDTGTAGFVATGNEFASAVKVTAMSEGMFVGNTFKAGFAVTGGSGLFRRVTFSACTWTDFAGPAVLCNTTNYNHPDVSFDRCTFYGTGNLTYGIQLGFASAVRWAVTNCKFIGLTSSGVYTSNGNATKQVSVIGCDFVNCANGIELIQAVNDSIFSDNTFTGITGWCITMSSITAGANLARSNFVNNVAASGCTNGLRISLSTGTWDNCIVALNNMNGCSGTKWSLSAGNAAGHTVNNITV